MPRDGLKADPPSELDWLGPAAPWLVPRLRKHAAALSDSERSCPRRAVDALTFRAMRDDVQQRVPNVKPGIAELRAPGGVERLMRPLRDAARKIAALPPGARLVLTVAQTTLPGFRDLDSRGGKPGPSTVNYRAENAYLRARAGGGAVSP